MNYRGSCHCGNVAFEVEGELSGVVDCNCSICVRKGALLWFVPRGQLNLLTPEENLRSYNFGPATIDHRFCPQCGIHTFGEGTDPSSGNRMAAVNVRCLEGVEISALPVKHFDGRAL